MNEDQPFLRIYCESPAQVAGGRAGALSRARLTRVFAFVCLLSGVAANVDAEWIADANVGFEYNDNLSLAPVDQDIEGDSALFASVSAGQHVQLADTVGLVIAADLGKTVFRDLSGLDHLSMGVASALRKKFGLGLYAPWLRVLGSGAWFDYKDDPRDGWRYAASVGVGKRLTQRWELQAEYRYETRQSDEVVDIPFFVSNFGIHGDAYDIDAHSVSLRGLCTVTERLALALGYTRREGEVTSTTQRNAQIFAASDANTLDPVFGPNAFAYRIDAGSNLYSVGLSWALGKHASANLSYQYHHSTADHGLEYDNNIVQVQYLYSY